MAAFLTANRWSSGIGTHKTREGRILCTGVGCLGCFPDTNQKEADELGVCDVDLNGNPFRPWLNDDYAVAKHSSSRKPSKQHYTGNSTSEHGQLKTRFNRLSHSQGVDDKVSGVLRSVGTQTPEHNNEDIVSNARGLSKETQKVLNSMIAHDSQRVEYQAHSKHSTICQGSQKCELENTIDSLNANNHNSSFADQVERNVNKTALILDNLYLMPKKDAALNPHDNILPEEHKTSENSPWDLGENAVCLYFAIEYFNSERVLPDFKVLEIVEALTDSMPVKDVKCVQKVAGMWQIVLRRRKYLSYFRQMGITVRGRVYQLVDDFESYCKVIYDDDDDETKV
ncbi:uncharacterized protein LOC110238584 [Exaiptasia diaphana]|uniref:Uncharacterized protein n=1 Tax=Exaiptasia diaphana TaxID=2652724 RepID=A0A913X865_EXADI|nr:uncharacterized protein LOC110238584 [Exaiptasia diaphana]